MKGKLNEHSLKSGDEARGERLVQTVADAALDCGEARAYYNECEPYAVEWLRNLIAAGLIAPGDVDSRKIEEVQPEDLTGYTQCHFFAGLGGWSYAARLAGWPDDRPLWTGSCPCQPFSVAGRRKGIEDERHLWPYFHSLIRASRPVVVMGEQTSGAPGYAWLDGVGVDLEAEAYTWRAVDIPACSVNAPEIRNRLYWVACASGAERWEATERRSNEHDRTNPGWEEAASGSGLHRSAVDRLESANGTVTQRDARQGPGHDAAEGTGPHNQPSGRSLHAGSAPTDRLDRAPGSRREQARCEALASVRNGARGSESERRSRDGFWDRWELIGPDPEGRYRRLKPGIALLDSGIPARVSKLRAIGNAINPQLAAEVIRAWMDVFPATDSNPHRIDELAEGQTNSKGGF